VIVLEAKSEEARIWGSKKGFLYFYSFSFTTCQ